VYFKVEVTHPKQRQRRRRGASLDVGDRRVDLERLGDRDATLGAEFGERQAANEGVTKKGTIGMLLPPRGNKKMNFEEVVTRGLRALLDGGDRLVDLESLSDRDTTLGADRVVRQAAKRWGNKNGMIGMLLTQRYITVTKMCTSKWR
jgi:hypothetical protein